MDMLEHISPHYILFFILYGITGVIPFVAAVYLLLRRGNAFAADVTPPVRLRRWAASFFGVSVLGHIWWLLFYVFSSGFPSSGDLFLSVGYVTVVVLDAVTLLSTIAGTLLAMLQDRKRPVWPVYVAMVPFVALGAVLMVNPSERLMQTAIAYVLLLYVLFTIYMVLAVRQYGRWLRDNYADLERKEVWLSQVSSLVFMLLFILYALTDINNIILIYLLHFVELALFVLLLWRVETLPQLEVVARHGENCLPALDGSLPVSELTQDPDLQAQKAQALPSNIGQLLAEYCVDAKLYLQHDLTLAQLSAAVGINRTYLSLYFSTQGMNYNAYINGLRIQHFVNLYQEAVAAQRPFTAQQLAQDSGYRSYSTFSLAFKQRMGQSVTAWMRDRAE